MRPSLGTHCAKPCPEPHVSSCPSILTFLCTYCRSQSSAPFLGRLKHLLSPGHLAPLPFCHCPSMQALMESSSSSFLFLNSHLQLCFLTAWKSSPVLSLVHQAIESTGSWPITSTARCTWSAPVFQLRSPCSSASRLSFLASPFPISRLPSSETASVSP